MAYKAIVDFKDLQEDHFYKAGDTYPYVGMPKKDRVIQLMTPTTQRGALIEEVTVVKRKKSEKATEKKED